METIRRPTASMFPEVATQEDIDRESRLTFEKKQANSLGQPFLPLPAIAFVQIALVFLVTWFS
jgi:hypothetical protein